MSTPEAQNLLNIEIKTAKTEKFAPDTVRLHLSPNTGTANKIAHREKVAEELAAFLKTNTNVEFKNVLYTGFSKELLSGLRQAVIEKLPNLSEETFVGNAGVNLTDFMTLTQTGKSQLKSRFIDKAEHSGDELRVTRKDGKFSLILNKEPVSEGLGGEELAYAIRNNSVSFNYKIPASMDSFVLQNARTIELYNIRLRWEPVKDSANYQVFVETIIGRAANQGAKYTLTDLIGRTGLATSNISAITVDHENVTLQGLNSLGKAKETKILKASITQADLDAFMFDLAKHDAQITIPVKVSPIAGDNYKGGFKGGFITVESEIIDPNQPNYTITLKSQVNDAIITVTKSDLEAAIKEFNTRAQSYGVVFAANQPESVKAKTTNPFEDLVAKGKGLFASLRDKLSTKAPAEAAPAQESPKTSLLGKLIAIPAPVVAVVNKETVIAATPSVKEPVIEPKAPAADPVVQPIEPKPSSLRKIVEQPAAPAAAGNAVDENIVIPEPEKVPEVTQAPAEEQKEPEAPQSWALAVVDNQPQTSERASDALENFVNRQVKLGTTLLATIGTAAVMLVGHVIKSNSDSKAAEAKTAKAVAEAKAEASDVATAAFTITVEDEVKNLLETGDKVIDKNEAEQLISKVIELGLKRAASYTETVKEEKAQAGGIYK